MFDARYLVDYASDATFAIDSRLKIVAWNYGARRLLGYRRREVLGRHCSEVLQAVLPNGAPLCVPGCEGAWCFERFQPFAAPACLARHKDGSWVPVSLATVVTSKRARNGDSRSGIAAIFIQPAGEVAERAWAGNILRISTFGRFGLAAGGHSLAVEKWERKQALTLLKFLVVHLGRAVPREVLIDCLWPEADERSGWERLKVTVYYLRRQLRAAGISEEIVKTVDKAYMLRREAVWVDAQAFEACIAEGSEYHGRRRWDDALDCYGEAQRLYRGNYLGEDIYADWCAEERERLREIHFEMLADMAECNVELGRFTQAVTVCRTILVDDPCREGIHRALMGFLVRLGNNDAALAQYRHCQCVLADELGVEPMPATQRLYRQIIAGEATAGVARLGQAAD